MDTNIAANNVIELLGLMPKAFAVYGTALGIIRENKILDHDLDTDIGIFTEDFRWEFITEAVQKGYSIISIFGMRHVGLEVSLRKDGIKTDIMVFYKDGEDVYNALWDNGGVNGIDDMIEHVYSIKHFEITTGLLNGKEVRTLGEEYLKHVYGDDWRIPIKQWDWRTSHKCRK